MKKNKTTKEQEIPSGHNPDDYIVERVEFKSEGEGMSFRGLMDLYLKKNLQRPMIIFGLLVDAKI